MYSIHPWQKAMVVFLFLLMASGCSLFSPQETSILKAKLTPGVIIRLIRDPVSSRPQHQQDPVSSRPQHQQDPVRRHPQHMMVLLPNNQGRTGQMIVQTSGGSQTLDRAYLATEIASPDAAPSPPAEMSPETVQRVFGAALSALPDSAVHIILYFNEASSVIIPESTAMIPYIVSVIKHRRSSDISVVGHADRVDSESFNLKLSHERAESVCRLLTGAGIPAEHLDVHFYGEKVPLIPTADGVREPRNRRVEVIVR